MQSKEKSAERVTRMRAKPKGPQCNQIQGSIRWKNRKFTFTVCATDAEKAAGKVTALIQSEVTDKAKAAIGLDCSGGEGCGDTQACLPADPVCNINVKKGPTCQAGGGATCTAPETSWVCEIWADVVASQQCGCKVPG
jgi:hypothetical protein